MWRCLLVVGISACTIRSATFTGTDLDSSGDASGFDDDVTSGMCNVPVALGLVTVPAVDGIPAIELTTARTPTGIVVVYTTQAGLSALTIDLTTPTPTADAEVVIGPVVAGHLGVVASGNTITASAAVAKTADDGIMIVQTDLALAPIESHTELLPTPGSSHHAASRADGGLAVVGLAPNAEELAIFDANDTLVTSSSNPLTGAIGGSIVALAGGGYAAVWDTLSPFTCDVRVLDDTLATIAETQLANCTAPHVSGSPDGERIVVIYEEGSTAESVTFDRGLASSSVASSLLSPVVNSPRVATSHDAFWIVDPASLQDLVAVSTDFTSQSVTQHALQPFVQPHTAVATYDVVGDGERAWAVWLSDTISPTLYIAELCR